MRDPTEREILEVMDALLGFYSKELKRSDDPADKLTLRQVRLEAEKACRAFLSVAATPPTTKPSGEAVAEDTRRLDHLAKSLHIDATGDEPIYAMFIAGVDPALRGPWDVRQLIDASILTCSSPTKEPK